MNALRRRLTYANVVATLALVLVVAGGGTAFALVVTGKQVKDRSLTGRDIKNSSLSITKLNATARGALTDTSPWERVPAGRTIQGVFSQQHPAVGANGFVFDVMVNLPARARVSLTSAQVNVAPNVLYPIIDGDSSCTGTVSAPTAPAGKVCVYIGGTSATSNIFASAATPADQGFWVTYRDSVGTAVYINGSWAYTAPG
jgi:hypothetical protein